MENTTKYIYNEGTNTEYSLDKTEKHNRVYTAHCIKYDEKFELGFYAPENYSKKQLKEIGQELAAGWGGCCTSVVKELTEQEKFEQDSKKWKYLCGTKYGRKFTNSAGETYMLVGFKGKRSLILAKDLNSEERYTATLSKKVPDYVLPSLNWC